MNIDEIGGWFPDSNRRTLETLIQEHEIQSVLEIGSFLGLSAAWFAMRVPNVTCIDLWREDATEDSNNNLVPVLRRFGIPRDFYDIFVSNLEEAGIRDHVTIVRGDSHSKEIADQVGEFDLVYIDGDHSLEGCTSDLELYGPKARKIICGDDYVERAEFGVVPAVNAYVPAEQLQIDWPFWWTVK